MESNEIRYIIEAFGNRLERANKRQFIVIIILIATLLITNGFWTAYVYQFQQEHSVVIEAEQESDNDGMNLIIGGDYGNKAKGEDN